MATTYYFYTWPPVSATTSSPSTGANGQPIPASSTLVGGENPSGDLQPLQTDASGNLKVDIASSSGLADPLPVTDAAAEASLASINSAVLARLTGSFVPTAYDEVALTYVTVGNGIGQIETAIYKLATSTVKTLTLSYDGSDRLSGVVAS